MLVAIMLMCLNRLYLAAQCRASSETPFACYQKCDMHNYIHTLPAQYTLASTLLIRIHMHHRLSIIQTPVRKVYIVLFMINQESYVHTLDVIDEYRLATSICSCGGESSM